jgi:hypothetical protein
VERDASTGRAMRTDGQNMHGGADEGARELPPASIIPFPVPEDIDVRTRGARSPTDAALDRLQAWYEAVRAALGTEESCAHLGRADRIWLHPDDHARLRAWCTEPMRAHMSPAQVDREVGLTLLLLMPTPSAAVAPGTTAVLHGSAAADAVAERWAESGAGDGAWDAWSARAG